ncbi:heterogeneous nuclear ribonucleoprotein H [Asbolus verrucosus]|uniref:Heterogeneous nuclear ribonucleoprotein H n=1 Tax=Asbolus verrucosus TaxID=1661398 RepID=A0A482VTK7_ASBVE|nr:heterogeneous nuclear ribonucleoprotein H [Asbolus verrucosus]
MSIGGDHDEGFIVKLRGLPWSATTDDILKFFKNCKVLNGKQGIHMTSSREGRPSGEAFVEFENDEDLKCALHKDREHIGSRYIEVFKVNKAEMDWVIKRSGPTYGINDDGCVRLRGLPFGCSKEEIAQFFTGLEIVPNGITLLTDYSGRSSGEAYVQFVNKEVAEKALLKHREKIGHRYIEIFRSSLSEVNSVLGYSNRRGGSNSGMYNSRPSPYDRGDRFGNSNRFQSRGSRNFKGANFSNNSSGNPSFDEPRNAKRASLLEDYNSYDRSSHWMSNNHNGSDSRGGRSPYEIDSWGESNQSGGDRNSGNMHCVHMRGLPFKATAADIADFFKPIIPINVRLLQDHTGRASGEADVEFASHDDAMRAMSKDKGHMQHRYIELFLNSAGNDSGAGYGGSGRRRL